MRIFCVGDSLTEGDYGISGKRGIANVHRENYPYFLGEISGHEVFCFGKCGYRASDYLSFIKNGGINISGADTVIIMLGTNGGMSAEPRSEGFFQYVEIVNWFRENEPAAEIVLCTPPHATENSEYSNHTYMPNIRSAAEAVRVIAREEKLPLIDVFGYPEICEETVHKYQSNDGLHFNEAGYRLLAEFIFGELKRIFPDKEWGSR